MEETFPEIKYIQLHNFLFQWIWVLQVAEKSQFLDCFHSFASIYLSKWIYICHKSWNSTYNISLSMFGTITIIWKWRTLKWRLFCWCWLVTSNFFFETCINTVLTRALKGIFNFISHQDGNVGKTSENEEDWWTLSGHNNETKEHKNIKFLLSSQHNIPTVK